MGRDFDPSSKGGEIDLVGGASRDFQSDMVKGLQKILLRNRRNVTPLKRGIPIFDGFLRHVKRLRTVLKPIVGL